MIAKWAVRSDDLFQYLNQHKPHIVHFSGHGSQAAEIILLERNRRPQPVSQEALTALLRALKDQIRVVVLNACFSRPQAKSIAQDIDCVVGMSRAISDEAAIAFAASFYRALVFGRAVQNAFDQGKTAFLSSKTPTESDTPQLLVRAGVDASKLLLVSSS